MTSPARAALTQGVEGLRTASLATAVRAADPAGEILRRGVAVTAFNLLETFIEGRLLEVTTHINQGHLHFADLPERVQRQATRNLLDVASARVRRMPVGDVRAFAQGVGDSLSAVSGAVNLSSLMWMWSGSNMSAADYSAVLKSFHVEQPWIAVAALSTRVGIAAGDPQTDLSELAQERHRAAHHSTHQVSNLWIPLAIDHVVKFAVALDAFVSVGGAALRRGDPAFLADTNWTGSVIGIRRVRERARDWAEFTESGKNAFRRGTDQHAVTMEAAGRCSNTDLLVITDAGGQIVDWSVPSVG
ncbi:hypothetical protein ACTU3I_16600 [Microbacterium sp. RD1]|uniref:hypothetical protein n=1 Tax=Microbacterium sp. RD1 TaxID=3457313 RepID=UPI003FA58872